MLYHAGPASASVEPPVDVVRTKPGRLWRLSGPSSRTPPSSKPGTTTASTGTSCSTLTRCVLSQSILLLTSYKQSFQVLGKELHYWRVQYGFVDQDAAMPHMPSQG